MCSIHLMFYHSYVYLTIYFASCSPFYGSIVSLYRAKALFWGMDIFGTIILTNFICGVMQVVISQMNGKDHSSHSVHSFNVGRMRIKLCRGWITKAREIYSPSMQVLFWQLAIILVSQNCSFYFFINMDNLDKELCFVSKCSISSLYYFVFSSPSFKFSIWL